ncbi:DUF2000 domain-containing protein [Labedaea rhizosphaerae]|uniref:DUF2000 family protein n=1 Tax=Labedaea rhizosphaerae TaxID=598644 RepID=A0A4R6RYK2_LABRH|nr:DUF2000 domain-containing protein [Labedaea rhizosphaerae]TDP91944.1 hypothetical protein EV186_108155 [Labedaea rhizosphaerae]
MRFDTKIAVAVRRDLAVWQKLNVTAFLASGIAAGVPELIGKPYEDADGNTYLALLGQPVLVFTGDDLHAAFTRATGRGLPVAVYTDDMFGTGNDEDNRAVVRAVAAGELRLAGFAVHGPRNAVDKICKGLALHE